MRRTSFQARIAGVLVLLVALLVGALYVAVQTATQVVVRNQAAEQLEAGVRVFEQLLELHRRQLQDAARLLAADVGVGQALAAGDALAIRAALARFGAQSDSRLVLLLDADGGILASSDARIAGELAERLQVRLARHQRDAERRLLLPIGERIYLLVQTPVGASLPSAQLLMGVALDAAFARELHDLTRLRLTLLASQAGQPDLRVSSLPAVAAAQWPQGAELEAVTHGEVMSLGARRYLSRGLLLVGDDELQVRAWLHRSLTQAQQPFAPLERNILLIALAGLLAALAVALLLARSIVQPLRQLAEAVERVGQGDYQAPLELPRSDELGSLARAFQHMQQGIAERERQLAHHALHDRLTGLPNRTLILERLGTAVAAGRPVALLYLGIDNLRSVNDNFGPAGADRAMQALCQRLQATLRPGDSLARVTADELLLLLEHADCDSAVAAGDRLQQALLKPLHIANVDVVLGCRIGIAAHPADGNNAEVLLRRANIAMQDAAHLPGRLQVYEQGRDAAHQRQIRLIRDLRRAPEQGELLLYYQPKLDLASGQVHQAEALLRWQHPQLGMVAPGEFIPLAERTGSIQLLSAWVIEESLRQLREWSGRGLRLRLSLNITTDDLIDPELPTRLGRLLERYQVPAERLSLEVTESAVMLNPAVALQVLHDLRARGVGLSVDDFGTGYSSLTQLKRMPVQELKIDQAFIRELDETSEDAVIVRSTIEMSHSLGLKVVAEGVELARSLHLLVRWQCDTVQGELISRPLSARAFEAWLKQPPTAALALLQGRDP